MTVVDVEPHTAVGTNAELVVALRGEIRVCRVRPDKTAVMVRVRTPSSRKAIGPSCQVKASAWHRCPVAAANIVITSTHSGYVPAAGTILAADYCGPSATANIFFAAADH